MMAAASPKSPHNPILRRSHCLCFPSVRACRAAQGFSHNGIVDWPRVHIDRRTWSVTPVFPWCFTWTENCTHPPGVSASKGGTDEETRTRSNSSCFGYGGACLRYCCSGAEQLRSARRGPVCVGRFGACCPETRVQERRRIKPLLDRAPRIAPVDGGVRGGFIFVPALIRQS
jgi:hypothetical protein